MTLKKAWPDKLVAWYLLNKRAMPWRDDPSPYKVWISEMMLQQTQVSTVIPYFQNFIKTFPTIGSLAASDQEKVLKLWEGLGYYSRARNLHKAAKTIIQDYDAQLPADFKTLQKLPGIGPYCAAAIASIAFGQAVPVVDGNVLRVFSRFWDLDLDIADTSTKNFFFQELSKPIQTVAPSDFNQAMMELGATVCKKQNPNCESCPLQEQCKAFKNKHIEIRPVNTRKIKQPLYKIAVGIIWKDNKILITKRKENQLLGGLWEFPGGKQESNETLAETVHREIKEELNIEISTVKMYGTIKHAYTHFKIELSAFQCQWLGGDIQLNSSTDYRWIESSELNQYPFPKANIKLFKFLFQEKK